MKRHRTQEEFPENPFKRPRLDYPVRGVFSWEQYMSEDLTRRLFSQHFSKLFLPLAVTRLRFAWHGFETLLWQEEYLPSGHLLLEQSRDVLNMRIHLLDPDKTEEKKTDEEKEKMFTAISWQTDPNTLYETARLPDGQSDVLFEDRQLSSNWFCEKQETVDVGYGNKKLFTDRGRLHCPHRAECVRVAIFAGLVEHVGKTAGAGKDKILGPRARQWLDDDYNHHHHDYLSATGTAQERVLHSDAALMFHEILESKKSHIMYMYSSKKEALVQKKLSGGFYHILENCIRLDAWECFKMVYVIPGVSQACSRHKKKIQPDAVPWSRPMRFLKGLASTAGKNKKERKEEAIREFEQNRSVSVPPLDPLSRARVDSCIAPCLVDIFEAADSYIRGPESLLTEKPSPMEYGLSMREELQVVGAPSLSIPLPAALAETDPRLVEAVLDLCSVRSRPDIMAVKLGQLTEFYDKSPAVLLPMLHAANVLLCPADFIDNLLILLAAVLAHMNWSVPQLRHWFALKPAGPEDEEQRRIKDVSIHEDWPTLPPFLDERPICWETVFARAFGLLPRETRLKIL